MLGDMGLFWTEGERLSGNYVEWAKAKRKEPGGTIGMKAPEVQISYSYVLLHTVSCWLCYFAVIFYWHAWRKVW